MVDDDVSSLEILDLVFGNRGWRVRWATDGAQALEPVRMERPSVIVSDISMPNSDGDQLCRSLTADAELATIPFIFCSATYTDAEDQGFALGPGADRFVVKTKSPDVLIGIVEAVVAEHESGAKRSSSRPRPDDEAFPTRHDGRLVAKLEDKLRELDRSRAKGATSALLALDVDAWREIDHTLGHHDGDLLLLSIADRLARFSEGELTARIGSDEPPQEPIRREHP